MYLAGCVLILLLSQTIGWSYHGAHGPSHWAHDYLKCGGHSQSPIDIRLSKVRFDPRLRSFIWRNYNRAPSSMTLKNNGHSARVDVGPHNMSLTGGGMKGRFVPAQFHFHWGSSNTKGSEHTINGASAPMEMHIVHYNAKYGSFENAADKQEGLAVLGVLFKISKKDNPCFAWITRYLSRVQYKDQTTSIRSFALMSLLPRNKNSYFRYSGSLTTPPCYESVRYWTIFRQSVTISFRQLQAFRKLQEETKGSGIRHELSDNFRPTQPLYGRAVTSPIRDEK